MSSPLPGELGRQDGPCDYDVRHNFTAQYVYQLPLQFRNHILARALNGWQVSGTAFWHSGLPFSVLSAPYSANGNGIVQGSGPRYASVIAGVPLYERDPIPGVSQPGTIQWLNPDAFVSAVDPSTGGCAGGDSPKNCQFGNLGRNALRGPRFLLERPVFHQLVSVDGAHEAARRRSVLQRPQSPEFRAPGFRVCWNSSGSLRRRPDSVPLSYPTSPPIRDYSASGSGATTRPAWLLSRRDWSSEAGSVILLC